MARSAIRGGAGGSAFDEPKSFRNFSAIPLNPMKSLLLSGLAALTLSVTSPLAEAFCGFYVAKADTQLFNQASKVVLVRDGNRTVLTLANDFSGDVRDFALVVPVPTFLERGQIQVGDKGLLEHLDAYTAPRLVEYFDEDPCRPPRAMSTLTAAPAAKGLPDKSVAGAKALGVTIEAQYTVGEYDILILDAQQSAGLATWLKQEGYRIPDGAEPVLESYLNQKNRFFVARVNLAEQAKQGGTWLRPLQIAYESPKFMLPIRLGTVNAKSTQDLFVFAITRKGRVETTNYRNVKLPADMDLPVFVKSEFNDFYTAMFSDQVKKADGRAVFTEYAWDMSWCDPCAADPLSADQLRRLGVMWLDENPTPGAPRPQGRFNPGGAQNAFITRLHVRYDRAHFPEDLSFQATGDRKNYQGRYVLRHPWTGAAECEMATSYRAGLAARREKEAANLATLTGWEIGKIRARMQMPAEAPPTQPGQNKWWEKVFKP